MMSHKGTRMAMEKINTDYKRWIRNIVTRFTQEEIVWDSWRIRNVLVPDWFCCFYTSGRIRNKNYPVWSCLRRFWIRNLKRELWIRELLNPESLRCNESVGLHDPVAVESCAHRLQFDGCRWLNTSFCMMGNAIFLRDPIYQRKQYWRSLYFIGDIDDSTIENLNGFTDIK